MKTSRSISRIVGAALVVTGVLILASGPIRFLSETHAGGWNGKMCNGYPVTDPKKCCCPDDRVSPPVCDS